MKNVNRIVEKWGYPYSSALKENMTEELNELVGNLEIKPNDKWQIIKSTGGFDEMIGGFIVSIRYGDKEYSIGQNISKDPSSIAKILGFMITRENKRPVIVLDVPITNQYVLVDMESFVEKGFLAEMFYEKFSTKI